MSPLPALSTENVRLFPGIGILLALAYVTCLTYSELLVTVTPALDAVSFMWFVTLCFSSIFIPVLLITRQNPWTPFPPRDRVLLVIGGASEVFCHVFIIMAVMRAPFGDVVTIWSTAIVLVPIVECLIAPYSPKGGRAKRCASHVPLQLFFALMAGAGVVVISRPSFLFPAGEVKEEGEEEEEEKAKKTMTASGEVVIGYVCALGNAFSSTSSYVIVGQLDHIRWAVVDFFFVPAAIVILPILTYFLNGFNFPSAALPRDYLAGIICGILDVIGAIFCTLGQKVVSASTVTLISTLEIPLSYFLDYVFNGASPTWTTVGGASLVMTSVVGATVHSIVDDAKQRKRAEAAESGRTATTASSERKNNNDAERMPLFGDEGEGEDESEEGEMWTAVAKKREEEEAMGVRRMNDRTKNGGNLGALSKLCTKGESDESVYETLP